MSAPQPFSSIDYSMHNLRVERFFNEKMITVRSDCIDDPIKTGGANCFL
jgi:hypothetical protein